MNKCWFSSPLRQKFYLHIVCAQHKTHQCTPLLSASLQPIFIHITHSMYKTEYLILDIYNGYVRHCLLFNMCGEIGKNEGHRGE